MVVHMPPPVVVGDGRGTAYPCRPSLKGVVWERDGDKLQVVYEGRRVHHRDERQ